MQNNKTGFKKFQKVCIIENMFFEHNAIKLEINNSKITYKNSYIWD